MSKDSRRITDGARDLRAYLDAQGLTIQAFCSRHQIDRIQVQRALNGELWKRISVDFAFRIRCATNGRVKEHRWRSATARAA